MVRWMSVGDFTLPNHDDQSTESYSTVLSRGFLCFPVITNENILREILSNHSVLCYTELQSFSPRLLYEKEE